MRLNKRETENTLPGHRKVEVLPHEYRFLVGEFGKPRRNKKSGLQAFQTRNPHAGDKNVFGNEISQDTKNARHAAVADLSQYQPGGISSPGGGTPSIPNPLADQGSTTQNFAGPSSRTRLDDPLEKLQGKVAGRASELM
ncbi:uncharacterized protein METZ01_LOCUS323436, partial [marine metagenome]